VEAPVKNVTDELAQSSQFDLGDFGGNASDNLADPVLDAVDGNAGTWAPDKAKESSTRLASGVEAIRCAEAHNRGHAQHLQDGRPVEAHRSVRNHEAGSRPRSDAPLRAD